MEIETTEYIRLAKLSGLAAILQILNQNNMGTLSSRDATPGELDLVRLGADYWRVFPLLQLAMEDYYDRGNKITEQ